MTPAETAALLVRVRDGKRLDAAEAMPLANCQDIEALMRAAAALRDEGHGDLVSYSRKVFIPLTKLCRDCCHYCTFAIPPRKGEKAYLSPDEVLAIAERGRQAGCHEALFTLGDKPELRYRVAREELGSLGATSTIDYLAQMAELVLKRTGLLPHVNPGVMTAEEIAKLRTVSISQGIMLETASERLSARGGPHFGSPDKLPAARLRTIEDAGKLAVPFTSGILIGIGETRAERIEALLALRDLHEQFGHLQEIIIQNFRAKPGTRMASADEPSLDEHLWTISVARLLFGPAMNIQAPPNLRSGSLSHLIAAGINDWGGVSPVTPDHVNPEAPWPGLVALEQQTAEAGKQLVQRLAIYPAYAGVPDRWVDHPPITLRSPPITPLNTRLITLIDASAFGREDTWRAGSATPIPAPVVSPRIARIGGDNLGRLLDRAREGRRLGEADVVSLFAARGEDFTRVTTAADQLRRVTSGDTVAYVVNRNINYTNVCYFKCQFCAFSKGKLSENLRGRPYVLDLDEIERRTLEAWDRGATEVCLQGGIHPDYTGATYLGICRRIKSVQPAMHIHAFSPLEIWQGAATLKMPVAEYLAELKAAGLSSLPGTAAEILDDEVRAIICPDKITTAQWLEVMEAAHGAGLRSTATIMFGHVDQPYHWARHLLRVRDLQERTGGFTEFVPLPFVPTEAPIYLKGRARPGPTYREAVLMHAVARLVLHPHISNIQTSWVKMGGDGAAACLQAGANDIGGTLMNESITRAAGAIHGEEMPPHAMNELIRGIGRTPRQRTTLYGTPPTERTERSFQAPPLLPPVQTPAKQFMRERGGSSGAPPPGE
ncbi:MAG: 5-amino-6-(D-ribitylamino)uracil--L-tyrosine 4-hydroxyphenyl transferase CofH [Hyphomicrobiaceae bacterium]